MKLNNPFQEIQALRERIGVSEGKIEYQVSMDPRSEIKFKLEGDGIEVSRDEIIKVGPFLTYKGDVLAILYIYDSYYGYEDLVSEEVTKKAPKFHFTWCDTLERMESKGRFSRYILSRRKNNRFKVQAKEREPAYIRKYGQIHEMEDVTLYACKNCMDQLSYKGYSAKSWRTDEKNKAVSEFSIEQFIDENEGILESMRFYKAHYTDNNVPRMDYTDDFPEISRRLREACGWACSTCNVNMSGKKEGLHVHHRNGVKSDNSPQNLVVLCALCHKNVDEFHKGMHVSKSVESYVMRNRPK